MSRAVIAIYLTALVLVIAYAALLLVGTGVVK